MKSPVLIVVYDPDGVMDCPPHYGPHQAHRCAKVALDATNAPEDIADAAQRLAALLLEQLAPTSRRI